MNPFDWRADYGNSNWDIRHRFVASAIYDLPFFKTSSQKFLHQVLGGWQLNNITTLQAGFPFNVTIPSDNANTGVGSQRPNLVGHAVADCGQQNLTNCISSSPFVISPQFTYGNAGRNILTGPHLLITDVSLFKNIPIREKARFQFRAEFFNFLNTPALANSNGMFGTGSFGSIGSTVHDNREIQFAAKVVF